MTPAETHAALCQQAAELTAAGRPIPESLCMELELADREACRAIRRDVFAQTPVPERITRQMEEERRASRRLQREMDDEVTS